jgi:hypothetical protein
MDYLPYKDIGIVAVVAIPLFFLIKWIAEEFKAQLIREHAERLRWAEIIQKFQECITQHTEKAEAFHQQVNQQHEQMIEVLGRINGFKK